MTALRLVRNENGGAMTEVTDTAVSTDTAGSIRAADNRESISRVALDQWSRFLRWLAETPEAVKVDRYREAQDEGNEELCRRGCGRPAAYNSECFSCLREEWSC